MAMQPDDDVCLCFHVSLRKLVNYLRIERPEHLSQLSECQGAGTGCGWCRPFLARLFESSRADPELGPTAEFPSTEAYSAGRQIHLELGRKKVADHDER